MSQLVQKGWETGSPEGAPVKAPSRTRDPGRKLRELECLRQVEVLGGTLNVSESAMLERALAVLRQGWRSAVSFRLRLEGEVYTSPDFRESAFSIAAAILVDGRPAGELEVFLVAAPPRRSPPFTRVERAFALATAEVLGHAIEHRRLAASLARSEAAFRAVFAQAAAGMARIDLDHRFLEVNPRFRDIVDFPAGVLEGVGSLDLLMEEDREVELENRRLLVAGERKTCRREARLARRDGTVAWVDSAISLVRDESGAPLWFIQVAQDITPRKQAYAELGRLNAELERRVTRRTAELKAANEELEAFAYSVSHDLRSPLRGIDGYSRVLLDDFLEKLDEEGRFVLGQIRASAQEMGQLIDDLLGFSRMGRQPMKREVVDMRALVQGLVRDLGPACAARKVSFVVGGLPPAEGDAAMLREVFRNLLENAVKYTRPRVEAMVEVFAEAADGDTYYGVRDNGVGFDMRYAQKLFKVFQRLHRSEEFEGTGVGLALVNRIITRHGGRVWAEAEVDKGAVFRFTLPQGDNGGYER